MAKISLHYDGNVYKIPEEQTETSIGRNSGNIKNDLNIPDGTVSKKHFIITQKDGVITVKDLGSKNHTCVRDKVLEKGDSATLKHGDTLKVGNTELIIQIDDQPLPKGEKELEAAYEPPIDDGFMITDEEVNGAEPNDEPEIILDDDKELQLKPKNAAEKDGKDASPLD